MIANKVRIENPNNPYLSQKKRIALRKKQMFEYIRSKPAGTPISSHELINVAQMKYSTGWAFINRLVKTGDLIREKIIHSEKYIFSIPGDAKIVTMPVGKFEKFEPTLTYTPPILTAQSKAAVMILAKEFYWQTTSSDLKQFVKWLEDMTDAS